MRLSSNKLGPYIVLEADPSGKEVSEIELIPDVILARVLQEA